MLDRYLGIPLILAFGMFRRKKPKPCQTGRIGVLNTAAIGDTILMSAPVADLREAYPKSEIVLLVGPSNYEAACMIEGADSVVQLEVFNPLSSIKEIRKQRLDMLLDFGPWSRLNALLSLCSGARFLIGFRTSSEHRHFGYDIAVEHSPNHHELKNYERMVNALGITAAHRPALRFHSDGHGAAMAQIDPFVVFHMWSGGTGAKFKEWPAARWIELAEELVRLGYNIVLTGSPDQRELNRKFAGKMSPSIRLRIKNLAGSNLAVTARLLSRAELVVSVNTGIMHLADTLRVRLVALHGPTSAKRWGPVNDTSISIESTLEGCGYLNLGFEFPRHPPKCMEAISFDRVLEACRLALNRNESHIAASAGYNGNGADLSQK
jgi:heptosyltransferase I